MKNESYIRTHSHGYVIDPNTRVILNINDGEKQAYEAQKRAFLESERMRNEVTELRNQISELHSMLEQIINRNNDVGHTRNN